MGSTTPRMIRHTGYRDLRPVELEYLGSIVRKCDNRDPLRGLANGVLISSIFWVSVAALVFL